MNASKIEAFIYIESINMKKSILIPILLTLFSLVFYACHKDENYTRYEKPYWQISTIENVQVNFSAIFELEPNLNPYIAEADELAAFVGDECRGTATLINGYFHITIKGTADESSTVTFRYYSSRNRYMYEAVDYVEFEPNITLGTIDNPEVLPLKIKK